MKYRWGVDLGGTKIEAVVLPEGSIEPIYRHRIDTEADKGYEHIVSRIEALISMAKAETNLKPEFVGIGPPGTLDPTARRMKGANTTSLIGMPLQDDIAKHLGCEVGLANDANCFALAEAKFGAAQGHSVVFGVIMGTGCGGGIVVNGKALYGHHGISGEWGHNVLEQDGSPCYCGKCGCVETVISGTGLQKWYVEQSGSEKKLKQIIDLARLGEDQVAVRTLDRLIEMFGKAIGTVVNILDPDIIVLGGGVGNISELYERGHESAKPWVFNPTGFTTPIVKPALGDSAGVFGAALLGD